MPGVFDYKNKLYRRFLTGAQGQLPIQQAQIGLLARLRLYRFQLYLDLFVGGPRYLILEGERHIS